MSDIQIFTGSWRTYKGPGRVGICQGNPCGEPSGYRMFKTLAPSWDLVRNHRDQAHYRHRYFREVLADLNAQAVVDSIRSLGNPDSGLAIMMCYEVPPFTDTNFCHRRMVAEWIEDKIGLVVPEYVDNRQSELAIPA